MKNSQLMRMNELEENIHEEDKRLHPEFHWLTKDSYFKSEMLDMCQWCAEHYEWNKQLSYDARTDRYYKNNLTEPME